MRLNFQLTAIDEIHVEQNKSGHVIKQLCRVRVFFLSFLTGEHISSNCFPWNTKWFSQNHSNTCSNTYVFSHTYYSFFLKQNQDHVSLLKHIYNVQKVPSFKARYIEVKIKMLTNTLFFWVMLSTLLYRHFLSPMVSLSLSLFLSLSHTLTHTLTWILSRTHKTHYQLPSYKHRHV